MLYYSEEIPIVTFSLEILTERVSIEMSQLKFIDSIIKCYKNIRNKIKNNFRVFFYYYYYTKRGRSRERVSLAKGLPSGIPQHVSNSLYLRIVVLRYNLPIITKMFHNLLVLNSWSRIIFFSFLSFSSQHTLFSFHLWSRPYSPPLSSIIWIITNCSFSLSSSG